MVGIGLWLIQSVQPLLPTRVSIPRCVPHSFVLGGKASEPGLK